MKLLNLLLAISIGIGTASAVEAKSKHHQNHDGEQIALKFFGGKADEAAKSGQVKVVEATSQETKVETKKEEVAKKDDDAKSDEQKKATDAKKEDAKKAEDLKKDDAKKVADAEKDDAKKAEEAKKDQAKKDEAAKKEAAKKEDAKRDEAKKALEKKADAQKDAAKKEAKEAKKKDKYAKAEDKRDAKAEVKKVEAPKAVVKESTVKETTVKEASGKEPVEASKEETKEVIKEVIKTDGTPAVVKEEVKVESVESKVQGNPAQAETNSAVKVEAPNDAAPVQPGEQKTPAAVVVTPPAQPLKPAKPAIPVAKPKSTDTATGDTVQMDSALMSVLRDIDKSIRDNEEVNRIEDPAQHAAVAAALNTLDIALDKASLKANRIVQSEHRDKLDKSLTAESWESGDLELPNGSHASLNVLWAKKVNGLVNISVTGNCGCRPNYAGERVGEWVVVLSGRSTLDKGFDIQSQSDVHFWLGKLTNFNVDATTCGDQISKGNTMPVLKALSTEQRIKLLAEVAAAAKKSSKEDAASSASSPASGNSGSNGSSGSVISSAALPAPATAEVHRRTETPAILQTVHLASPHAHLLVPKRAIAGEYITASVIDQNGKPESFVELSFNDTKASTNVEGRASFQVPEDAEVGPSLSVNLAGRDSASPEQVFIIQPLVRASATDVPRIDKWNVNRAENTITIEGHNFDGVAANNRVILDAHKEAIVRFSSPVELQAHVADLSSGGHAVIVQRNGIRSEPISLSIIDPTPAISSKTKKKS